MTNFVEIIEKQGPNFIEKNKAAGGLLNWESECLFAKQQIMKTEFALNVAKNNQGSLSAAIQNLAAIGLSLNPALAHAYLVPRRVGKDSNNKAVFGICLDVSYRGMVKLATDGGLIEWAKAELVYANDTFKYKGAHTLPELEADVFGGDRGECVGGYSLAKLSSGGYLVDTMTIAEINRVRDTSSAYTARNGPTGPWVDWTDEMRKKTLIKRGRKSWPEGNGRLALAVNVINEHEGTAYTLEQQAAYLEALHTGNEVAFAQLKNDLSYDAWSALYNSFGDGEKVKLKKLATDLESKGNDKLAEIAVTLLDAAKAEDVNAVSEILAEFKIEDLSHYLDKNEVDEIKQIGVEV